jgi:hypothetical protein
VNFGEKGLLVVQVFVGSPPACIMPQAHARFPRPPKSKQKNNNEKTTTKKELTLHAEQARRQLQAAVSAHVAERRPVGRPQRAARRQLVGVEQPGHRVGVARAQHGAARQQVALAGQPLAPRGVRGAELGERPERGLEARAADGEQQRAAARDGARLPHAGA